jgi:hypothetical protein
LSQSTSVQYQELRNVLALELNNIQIYLVNGLNFGLYEIEWFQNKL